MTETCCELREVVLKDKPPSLIEYSPKATVPVLVLEDGTVIDESLDVMLWALKREDPEGWLSPPKGTLAEMVSLIDLNDNDFKRHLDRYKYPNRYEGTDPLFHRTEAQRFLGSLDARIRENGCLFGPNFCLADAAIGPFVRQFANTNQEWFQATPYEHLKGWLKTFLDWPLFKSVMASTHSGAAAMNRR